MRTMLMFILLIFESSFALAELPLKASSNQWVWQGIYALFVAVVLLGLAVLTLWLVKNKVLSSRFFGRSVAEEAAFKIFPNQRIQILSSRKLSVKIKAILISVDDVPYLVVDNGQSIQITPHQYLAKTAKEALQKAAAE